MSSRACLACGGTNIFEVLDLGRQAPVNDLAGVDGSSTEHSLGLCACEDCGHGQLTEFLNPHALFDDYLYASSTSGSLRAYDDAFASQVARHTAPSLSVLELASNDGLLLQSFADVGITAVGVDPASRMVDRANSRGLKTYLGYWPDVLTQLGNTNYDFITGHNVLAHTPDPLRFMMGVAQVLAPGGVAVFQTSQADMVANGEFDTIYHEHYSFFCEDSARALGVRAGLPGFSAAYSAIHGNSALFVFSMNQPDATAMGGVLSAPGEDWSKWIAGPGPRPDLRKTRKPADWADFGDTARSRMREVREVVERTRLSGRRVIAVGAAAKGITFLRAAGVSVDALIDEAPDKIGREVPGLNVRITSLTDHEYRVDDLLLITAWNFARELSQKTVRAGAANGTEVCLYFPSLRLCRVSDLV